MKNHPYYMPSVEEMINRGLVDPNYVEEKRPEPPPGYEYYKGSLVEIEDDEGNAYGW